MVDHRSAPIDTFEDYFRSSHGIQLIMKVFKNVSFGKLSGDSRVGRDLAAPGGKLLSQSTISTSEIL